MEVSTTKAKGNARPKKKFNFKMFLGLFFLFLLVLGGLFAYDRISSYSSRVQQYDEQGNLIEVCDNILNPKCWTEAFRPQLKQSDGFSTVLVIGVDTRSGSNSLMNTDSIIAVTFNHKTQEIMMVSIPRDFWSFTYQAKINAVYAYTYQKGRSQHNDEFYYLKEEVTKIIGKPIQYTAKVRFEGVTTLVDRLGGVEVCPTDSFTAKYPNDDWQKGEAQWLFFPFTKGCQQVTGELALVYARFRHVSKGPDYLASDFSRARRQQEVINAIKAKALSDNIPLEQRAETYWSLFQSFGDIISIDITFEDMMAALSFINTFDRTPINVVLDPNFISGNKFIYTDSNPTQGYTIKARDTKYSALSAELNKVWTYSAFYRETPVILVRNQTGEKNLPATSLAAKIKTTSYYKSYSVVNDPKSTQLFGIHVFDFTNGKKPESAEYIRNFVGAAKVETLPEEFGIARSKANEDFVIVVGPAEPTATPSTTASPTPTN